MADIIYNSFKEYMADGTIDMDGDSFKIALLDNGHTPAATHSVWADVSADEISGDGYTTGGQALTSVVWDRTAGTVKFDAANPQWTGATFTARYAVIYDDTPESPADPLVCLIDFGADKTVENNTFTVQFHEDGILTLS